MRVLLCTKCDSQRPVAKPECAGSFCLTPAREQGLIVQRTCWLLVEDESQQEFVTAVAPTLGEDLDAKGISVIAVGGQDAYAPYLALLTALGIPTVGLRDLEWGDAARYPPDRFFALGAELEDYLDKHGLAEKRAQVALEVGTSKRRVAGVLGTRLSAADVPAEIASVLRRAVELSTTGPVLGAAS